MQFQPFVYSRDGRQIPVTIAPMEQQDAESTNRYPLWQTSWTSEYLADPSFK